MSDRQTITELKNGEGIDLVFLVRDKGLRTTRSGDLYITLTLADRTGTINARMWQATEAVFQGIPDGGFLQVRGRVEEYRGSLQVVVDGCMPVASDAVELADFTRATDCDVDAMWAEVQALLQEIQNEPLRRLMKKFQEDTRLMTAFRKAPAAMQMHHPYVGGLLEHTLGVMRGAKAVCPLYPQMNADLLMAGAFLHDIAKTAELTSGAAIGYTDRGQLVGHITIASIWIQDKAAAIAEETGESVPAKTITLLQHLVLSHHGVYEYGSPKLPAIPEAFILHYLDNMDAKAWMTAHAIDDAPDASAAFTPYLPQLESRVYRFSGHLDDFTPTGDLFGGDE
jgi:3'-5' exoribonuclease